MITSVSLCDSTATGVFCCQVMSKSGEDAFSVASAAAWLRKLGYKRIELQCDKEHNIMHWVKALSKKADCEISVRTSPKSDSASLGFGEQINWTLASMFRTNKSSVEKRFDVVIGPNSQIVP